MDTIGVFCDIIWVSHGLGISCTHFPQAHYTTLCTHGLLYRISNLQYSPGYAQGSVFTIMYAPKFQVFSGTNHQALLWLVGCSKVNLSVLQLSSLQQKKQMQAFSSYKYPKYWLVTHGCHHQFSLRDCEREEGRNFANLFFTLIFLKSSHPFSMSRGEMGLLLVRPILFFSYAHLILSDPNYGWLIRFGLLSSLTQLLAAKRGLLNTMEQN